MILVLIIGTTGHTGAAAITAALTVLGPGGMIGGVITLLVSGTIFSAVTKYGVDSVFNGIVKELLKKGETKETIIEKINNYPLSNSQKLKLKDRVNCK